VEVSKLILDYVKAMVWPLVVVFSICLFRKNIEVLIGRIKKFDTFGVSVEVGESMVSEAKPKAIGEPPAKSESQAEIELSVSTGGYSSDYRAIFLVVGITNRGNESDQVITWKLYFQSQDVELEPTPAPPNLVSGVPWWPSPLVKIPANEFVQGGLFFRGRKALQEGLPKEPLSGKLVAKTLHGKELTQDVKVYRLSTLQQNPALDR
jgi:hypothetical protein